MPEGHTIHRAARDHREVIEGKKVSARSPQGRFSEGAAEIDGAVCTKIEALGKHLLYRFDTGQVLHVHLGLGGYFVVSEQPVDPPREVTRLRMEGPTHAIDIIGPNTCELLPETDLPEFRLRYGPDLLAEEPDPDRAIDRIMRSRAPIARLLMDQKVIAGIGNIYRAEILWLRRIAPLTPGVELDRRQLMELWNEMRSLLQMGVETNTIITTGDATKIGVPVVERTNIFAKEECPECGDAIVKSTLSGRTLYHCPTCQA